MLSILAAVVVLTGVQPKSEAAFSPADAASAVQRCASSTLGKAGIDTCMIRALNVCYNKYDPRTHYNEEFYDGDCVDLFQDAVEKLAEGRVSGARKPGGLSMLQFKHWKLTEKARCEYEAIHPDKDGGMPNYGTELPFCEAIGLVKLVRGPR